MFVVAVTIFVKPEFVDQFIEVTFDNARNTRKEAMNVRFDVLRSEDDPTRFFLYEVYQAAEGFVQHKTTAHYARWNAAVANWMAQPRQGVKHHTLFFGEAETPVV